MRTSFYLVVLFSFLLLPGGAFAGKIPVIYDSDIGDDIDDTWAIGFLLRCPELDLKLVVGDQGKALYRAKLFAKLLEAAGRTDVPIGIGLDTGDDQTGNQSKWVEGYDLESYPGKVHKDGVQALIDTIMKSDEQITLICVGPVPNIAEALKREPRIAQKARFVGMHGSVYQGYGGSEEISAEYNVQANPKACQTVLSAEWDITITPVDTCGRVQLKTDKYLKFATSNDPLATAIMENYRIWIQHAGWMEKERDIINRQSSSLYDTVAVYLSFSDDLLVMEDLTILVDDKGFTRINSSAKKMSVAVKWKDMGKFEDLLVSRLTSHVTE